MATTRYGCELGMGGMWISTRSWSWRLKKTPWFYFLREGHSHENTRAQIRNPAPRGGAAGSVGDGIEPHLERIGIRTQRSRRRTGRDVFHVRRTAPDLHAGCARSALDKTSFLRPPSATPPPRVAPPSDPGFYVSLT